MTKIPGNFKKMLMILFYFILKINETYKIPPLPKKNSSRLHATQ